MSMTSLHYEWAVSTAAISQIVPGTCEAIHKVLKDDFLTTPTSAGEWVRISAALEEAWNFPNALGNSAYYNHTLGISYNHMRFLCLAGAIDGEHALLTKPWHAGSQYHNDKGMESIVLMAVCDANYR